MKCVLALIFMSLLMGCEQPEPNLLKNPSFEEGEESWFWMETSDYWQEFCISDQTPRTGNRSCLTLLEASPQSQSTLIVGAVQDIFPSSVPEKVSGYYYVEMWKKNAEKMYIQVVIIFFQDEKENYPSTQLRYVLAGISREPFLIGNAKFIFVTREEPEIGRWIHFEMNVKKDLLDTWGEIPSFKRIGLYLEVRYDSAPSGEVGAAVYWDDIFLG